MTDVVLVDTDVFSYLWQGRPEGKAFEHLVVGKIAALSFTTVAAASPPRTTGDDSSMSTR